MSNPESSPKSSSVSDLPGENHDSAVSACTSHHGDCLGNQLLGFVCGDDESNQTSTIGSSLLSRKRKDMTGQSEELEDIRVNVKREMVHESINRLKELNTELGEAYNRQVEKLKTHYEEKISRCEHDLMQSKQEMDAVRQRYEHHLSEGGENDIQTVKDLELDEAKELLERARVEERQAKLNLEKVLQDNYLREEEILRLNRLLLEQREKEELEIWTTKERFDECLIKTLEERGAEITEYKKKVEELERKIAGLQIHSNDLKSPEDIFRDDLEALQLERNALKQVNERYVRLISDYVRMSAFLEQRTNAQLPSSGSSSRTSSGFHPSPIPSGQQHNKWQLTDVSADEPASSVASTTDEGLEVSRCFPDGLFSVSDFDTEYEEAAKEASISIQQSFERLIDAVSQSTGQSSGQSSGQSEESQKLKELIRSTENTNKDLMEVCEEFQEKLQTESSAVTRLTEQLRIKEEELDVIKKAMNELSEKQKRGGDEENELISSLYRTVEDLELKLNTTKQRETDLYKKNQELEQIIKDFEEVRTDEESMQTKFCEQLILISSLKSQLDEQKLMTNEYIKDAKNVSHWKEIVEQEKESGEVKDKKINDLNKEATDLQQQVLDNHVELDKFRTEIEICKKQRIEIELELTESHRKEVSELSGTLKERETVIQNLTAQVQSKQNELDTLTNANSQLKHHYEIETNRLREQLDEKKSLLEIQIDEMSSLQSQLDRKDVRISQLTDELDSSEEDLAKQRRSFETERKRLVDSASKMENEILSLTGQLNQEKEINVEKASQLKNLERELDGREKMLEKLRNEKQELLRRIDELETDVAKLKAKLDDGESEMELAQETLEDNKRQMRIQLQKIEEMKRHHKKEVQDLLEDKAKELESLHKAELDDLKRSKQMESEELKTRLLKANEKELADLDLRRRQEIEELQRHNEDNLKELKSRHAKELETLLRENEKEVKELKASHKKNLDSLCRDKEKERDAAQSKHLEEMNEVEKSLDSQRQRQLQKLKEQHKEDLNEMGDEINSCQETIRKLERQIAESAKQRELENVELNVRHARELNELKKIRETQEKEMQTMQNELSKSHKSVEELKQRIAQIEIKKSEESKNLSDKHVRDVAELKLVLGIQNDERLQKVTEKHETALNEMRTEVTKLHTVNRELKSKISEGENRREKENNETEIRRTQELKELRMTLERQNDEQLQAIVRKHKQAVCEMDDKLKNYQGQVGELKQTIAETARQRDRVIRESSATHEREKDTLRTALAKEDQRRLDEILHRHRQEVENLQDKLAMSENSAKELENRYSRELREKIKETNEASAKHAKELEALRALLQSENEEQFSQLSKKYEHKFRELRDELEKNNSLMRETEVKQSRKTEDMKTSLNDATLRNSHQPDDVIDDKKKQELQERLNQYQGDIRKLEDELHRQQEAVVREKERGEERLRELISKHSNEVKDLKAVHQRSLDEAAESYREEMSDLRQELCKSRDILTGLNVEHSRELGQLREELSHLNETIHDNRPATFYSETVKLETGKSRAVPSQEAWQLERQCLLAEIAVFQNLLKEIGNGDDSKDSESMDWRTDILKAMHDVLTRQINRTTVSEIYLPLISKNSSQEQELNALLRRNMAELEQFYSRGLDQILAVDRKSMLDEIDDLRQQIGSLQRVLLDDNKDLTEKLNGLELRYKKRQKRLKNQLNASEAQLSEEREMRNDLQTTIDVERLLIEQLKDQLNQEKELAVQLKNKISQLQMKRHGSENALNEGRTELMEERFVSEPTATEPTHERFQDKHGNGQMSDVIERLKLELLQEKEEHLQTKCDLAWERDQRNNLQNKIKTHWEEIGSLDADGDLILDTDLHNGYPVFQDEFCYSMRREELILLQCKQLQRLVAIYRDDLSKCSILSRDTSALNKGLMSIYQSLDSFIRNENRLGNIGINLSSRLLALSRRCLRAEEHIMALAYQKRYLLLLIGGFQDNEQETLAAIARLGVYAAPAVRIHSYRRPTPLNRFRKAVQTVIAVIRLRCLAKRWGSLHGDIPKPINSVSTWRTLSSGFGTGRENQSFSSLSFDGSMQSVGKDQFASNRHRRTRSPTSRARALSRTTPRAFDEDDDIMSRSCDFGSETLSLIYSHYPRSPSRSSTKRRCWDESDFIRRRRLSRSPQSTDFRSRKFPVRPASTYLW